MKQALDPLRELQVLEKGKDQLQIAVIDFQYERKEKELYLSI